MGLVMKGQGVQAIYGPKADVLKSDIQDLLDSGEVIPETLPSQMTASQAAEASYKGQPLRQMLQEKAYCLFDYVEAHDSTFSVERRQKMDAMRRELGEILPLAH